MTTFKFSDLVNNQTIAFNPSQDALIIDSAGVDAASGVLGQNGGNASLSYQGKTIFLAGTGLAQLSSAHITFADGSRLLVGDNSPGVKSDNLANTLTGTAHGDMLVGLDGSDRLDGKAGADTMVGGKGTDIYFVNDSGDRVVELPGEGTDTVNSSLPTYALPSNVENLTLLGTANLNGVGNSLSNQIIGNAGSNLLDGRGGADIMVGGNGNDKYRVDNVGDIVVETNSSPAQIDTVLTSLAKYTLPTNVENLTLLATGNASGTGNTLANTLTGTAGANILSGKGGADTLSGNDGDDTLIVSDIAFKNVDGGNGNDTLVLDAPGLTLDLAQAGGQLHNIETIDLQAGNTLLLTAASLQNLSSVGGQLIVKGKGDSIVNAGSGWAQGSDVALNGHSYHSFTQGTANLLVETTITTLANGNERLSDLNGVSGFRFDGEGVNENAGISVSAAGDVNGDGYGDLIIGTQQATSNGKLNAGTSYVVFGKPSGFADTLNGAALNGNTGFRIDFEASDALGITVSAAGDVNGDGFADLIVGTASASQAEQISCVVFGKDSAFPASVDISTLNGTNGFRLEGSGFASQVGSADVNGDGFSDLIVGDFSANNGRTSSTYVVFGKAQGFAASQDLSSLNGSDGFRLDGAGGLFGVDRRPSADSAGDINGDGYTDLLVASLAGVNVVFGKASGFAAHLDLSRLNGTDGFHVSFNGGDFGGISTAKSAGDVNGDGIDDLILGAPGTNAFTGSSFVLLGQAGGFGANVDVSILNGNNGFRLNGVNAGENSGLTVSSAGDVNGDGYADLLIGGIQTYVVYGKTGGFDSTLNLSELDGSNGFRLDTALSGATLSVHTAGDVNGDGYADLIIGTPFASPNNISGSGSSYVLFGGNFSGAVTYAGLAGADTLTGTAAADRFVSGQGNDTLTGKGGADVFKGGEGDDRIEVPDLNFQQVDGGTGIDTLALTGSGLNLSLADLHNRISGIERIDLGSGKGNSLILQDQFIARLSDTSNNLRIDGDASDFVKFNTTLNWLPGDDVTTNGQTYHTFTQKASSVWIDSDIATDFSSFGASVQLARLDGNNGFRIDGAATNDESGVSVSSAGDVNGDGYDDLIVGTLQADFSYVVFGKPSGLADVLNVSSLDGSNGFRVNGQGTSINLGFSVSAAGDVNSDGFADVIIGAPSSVQAGGASYVVFGKASDFSADLNVSALDGTNGFRLNGISANDQLGQAVGSADVNGDGYSDLIIGDPLVNGGTGSTYVVFGKAQGFAASQDLSSLNGSNGFRLDGAGGFFALSRPPSADSAGDINGDGYTDLLVASLAGVNVVFGKASGFAAHLDLATLNGTDGFHVSFSGADSSSGGISTAKSAGDVNGDGIDDLILGAPGTNAVTGSSFVLFGQTGGFGANVDVSTLNGNNGFRLNGVDVRENSGLTVSSAGDVNGDGYADLLVGGLHTYVVYGKTGGFDSTLNLSALDGSNGFRLDPALSGATFSVHPAGDVNGDGYADLIIGTPFANPNNAKQSGSSYVLFGGNSINTVTHFGTPHADTVTGTAAADRFVSGQGNDTLTGQGGADVFEAGQGDDVIHVPDLNFQRVDGGTGSDTLALDGAGLSFNLADFRSQLFGVENIDLTGRGDNTLSLLKQDMVNLSDTSNTLQVNGNAGDKLDFLDSGWVQGADVTLVGVAYHTFDNGAAHVLVNADVAIA